MTPQLLKEPFIAKEDAETGRSKELMKEVAEEHPFPHGFPRVVGLIAVLGPAAIAAMQFLLAFDFPEEERSNQMMSESWVVFGCLWLAVSMSSLNHCCARPCFKFNHRMTCGARVCYWCMAVPAVVVHIGTLVVLWLDCEPRQDLLEIAGLPVNDNVVVRLNLLSALCASYAVILPMVRRMQFDRHMALYLIQRWGSEAEKLLQAMTEGSEFTKSKGMDLINDYRATRACISISGICKPWVGLNSIPWLQSISIGIFTEFAVLYYWLSYGLHVADVLESPSLESGVKTRFVVALSVVAFLLIFAPLYYLEMISRPTKEILKRMRKFKLHAEIPTETLQTYNLLLSVLEGEPMKVCLLRIPALGISLTVDQRFNMKALLLFVVKIPAALTALHFVRLGMSQDGSHATTTTAYP